MPFCFVQVVTLQYLQFNSSNKLVSGGRVAQLDTLCSVCGHQETEGVSKHIPARKV